MIIINWPDKPSIRAAIAEADNILAPEFRDRYVANEIMPAKRRMPAMATCEEGGFALAFILKEKNSSDIPNKKILKVFFQYWKEDYDRTTQRFNLISSFINSHHELNKYFVDFHFIRDALRVGGEHLPGISMDLVNGDTLGDFFVKCRERGRFTNNVFATLAKEFLEMCRTFRHLGMAHGDLSNKNIIVTPGHHIKLIDYDSVFVPDMGSNFEQTTSGDAHFQHPTRIESDSPACNNDDNFSQIVIYTILLALSKDSSLLQIANKDEVFMAEDFVSETSLINSRVYKTMAKINDSEVNYMLQFLRQAVNCKKSKDIPFLADIIKKRVSEEPKKVDGKYRYEIPKSLNNPVGKKGERCVFCNFIISNGYPQANNCPNCGAPRVTYKITEKI